MGRTGGVGFGWQRVCGMRRQSQAAILRLTPHRLRRPWLAQVRYGAHGFLLHEFLSPLANQRSDEYGGSESNRMRFACAVVESVGANWPAGKPLFLRLSAEDDTGWGLGVIVRRACRRLAVTQRQLRVVLIEQRKRAEHMRVEHGGRAGDMARREFGEAVDTEQT